MTKHNFETICAKLDKEGKIIKHAVASLEWRRKNLRKTELEDEDRLREEEDG